MTGFSINGLSALGYDPRYTSVTLPYMPANEVRPIVQNINAQNQATIGNMLNGLGQNAAQREASGLTATAGEIPRLGDGKKGYTLYTAPDGKNYLVSNGLSEQQKLSLIEQYTGKKFEKSKVHQNMNTKEAAPSNSGDLVPSNPEAERRAAEKAKQGKKSAQNPIGNPNKDLRNNSSEAQRLHEARAERRARQKADEIAAKQDKDLRVQKRLDEKRAAGQLRQSNDVHNTNEVERAKEAADKRAEQAVKDAGNKADKTPLNHNAQNAKKVESAQKAATEEAEQAVKDAGKKAGKKGGGFFAKVGKFFKGKGGKYALITAGVAAVAAGIAYLVGKDKKGAEDVAADVKDNTNNGATKGTTGGAAPVPTTPSATEATTPAVPPTTPIDPNVSSLTGIYTVVKGDNVWNIAKARLKEKNGVEPTNKEIRDEVDRIMERHKTANAEKGTRKLEWSEKLKDGHRYYVMIQPGDKLDLTD